MMWRVAPTPRFNGTRNLFIDIGIYRPEVMDFTPDGKKSVRVRPVTLLIVGNTGNVAAHLEEHGAGDVAVERWPEEAGASGGREEIDRIARDLRELERALSDSGPDAVLAASDSPTALAAVLVATKVGVAVACLEGADGAGEVGTNAHLIRQLADTRLAPDPAAILAWARDGYPARK